jgi:hypothetical protein
MVRCCLKCHLSFLKLNWTSDIRLCVRSVNLFVCSFMNPLNSVPCSASQGYESRSLMIHSPLYRIMTVGLQLSQAVPTDVNLLNISVQTISSIGCDASRWSSLCHLVQPLCSSLCYQRFWCFKLCERATDRDEAICTRFADCPDFLSILTKLFFQVCTGMSRENRWCRVVRALNSQLSEEPVIRLSCSSSCILSFLYKKLVYLRNVTNRCTSSRFDVLLA